MDLLDFAGEESVCWVQVAARNGDGLRLEIEVRNDDTEQMWLVSASCDRLFEFVVHSGIGSSLDLIEEHPLLWEYHHDHASGYFSGAPADSFAAVGAIAEAHRSVMGDWYSFTRYLNCSVSPKNLLESGSGLLAQGPLPLLEIYKEALAGFGVDVQIVSPHPSGGRFLKPEMIRLRCESQVLVAGDSYAIGTPWKFSQSESAYPAL
jgi:hypothetical protein